MEWIAAFSVVLGGTGAVGLIRFIADRAYPRRLEAAIARNARSLTHPLDPKTRVLIQQAIDTDAAKLAAASLARTGPATLTALGVGGYAFALFAGLVALVWAGSGWSGPMFVRLAPIIVILGSVLLMAPYMWLVGSAARRRRQYDYATATLAQTQPAYRTPDVEHGRRVLWVQRVRARAGGKTTRVVPESRERRRWRRRRATRRFLWSAAPGIPTGPRAGAHVRPMSEDEKSPR